MRLKEGSVADTVSMRMYHHRVSPSNLGSSSYEWEVKSDIPFDELIVSWNGSRPTCGGYSIFVAVEVAGRWSPFLLYAGWGALGQFSGDVVSSDFGLKISQDILELSSGELSTAFKIRLEADSGAAIDRINFLHASVACKKAFERTLFSCYGEKVDLDVPLVSQFSLDHARRADMCSPASTSSVVGYLQNRHNIDPIRFANRVHDDAHDIYGNWVLNVAHASDCLGKGWICWVERLSGFERVYESLCKGVPVVVSIKGPLPGAPLPYANGHLVVVKGYDSAAEEVLCMDPAFPSSNGKGVRYPIDDFMEAWSRRRFLAYIFERENLG